ncbi:MAG: DUF309 domain-containing protein [Verrucomicrobiales bacterium]|nr:DUF309 domain-containing protein [Verrucomicrobiales bacterium]
MSKSDRIAHLRVDDAGGLDPHYAGWFACFNRGKFYEAHDVLEDLWLRRRGTPNDLFYKGLIQLAGAFVHLQKGRLGPADALFRLAQFNLGRYRPVHEHLDLEEVLGLIGRWRADLTPPGLAENPLSHRPPPHLAPRAV